MPVIARVATAKQAQVIFICLRSPPSLRMSPSSALPCITLPAERNRQALKKAWVTTWRNAAQKIPAPTAMNMKPSCETVE